MASIILRTALIHLGVGILNHRVEFVHTNKRTSLFVDLDADLRKV